MDSGTFESKSRVQRIALLDSEIAALERKQDDLRAAVQQQIQDIQRDIDSVEAEKQKLIALLDSEITALEHKQDDLQAAVQQQIQDIQCDIDNAEAEKQKLVNEEEYYEEEKERQYSLFPGQGPYDKPGSALSKWMKETLAPQLASVERGDWMDDWEEDEKSASFFRGLDGPKVPVNKKSKEKKGWSNIQKGHGSGKAQHRRRGKKGRRFNDDDDC